MSDGLTPREHDAMRANLLAGSRRIKPEGKHRKQIVAGALSVLLVAVIAGGAVTAASLYGAREIPPVTTPTPTPTETTTPTPTPTETEEPEPLGAVSPFDGVCANVVDLAWMEATFGVPMIELPMAWRNPETVLAGGLDCLWSEEGAYMAPSLSVEIFPAVGQEDFPASCEPEGGWCTASITADGVWISARAGHVGVDAAWMDGIMTEIATRADAYTVPRGAERAPDWWALPDCVALDAAVPPEWRDRIRPPETSDAELPPVVVAQTLAESPYYTECLWEVLGPEEAGGIWAYSNVVVIPGGGYLFDDIAQVPDAVPATVAGADAAVMVRDNYQWEGYAPALVSRVGANLLIVRGDNGVPVDYLIPLAEAMLLVQG